jgi:IS30 family transposase
MTQIINPFTCTDRKGMKTLQNGKPDQIIENLCRNDGLTHSLTVRRGKEFSLFLELELVLKVDVDPVE